MKNIFNTFVPLNIQKMKVREFNRVLNSICIERNTEVFDVSLNRKVKVISEEKVSKLDNQEKNDIINYLVRNRFPIVSLFINDDTDRNWLSCMGYLYEKKNKYFTFLCTSENMKKI